MLILGRSDVDTVRVRFLPQKHRTPAIHEVLFTGDTGSRIPVDAAVARCQPVRSGGPLGPATSTGDARDEAR
jgi:hypothetical protein